MTSRTQKKSQRPFLYRSLSSYLKAVFGRTYRKVSLDPGYGCPNRDGTLDTGGCAFCNMESFVPPSAGFSRDVVEQMRAARAGKGGDPFIAYLQAGTGTHTDPASFRTLVDRVCSFPGVAGLFIGTRPDCVSEQILDTLVPWAGRKLIWLELGLQSSRNQTLDLLNRGHDRESFSASRSRALDRGIPVLAHVILGLPGEDKEAMMETARYLADHNVEGVKIHHLQVIRGTRLEEMFRSGQAAPLDPETYPDLVAAFLERLPSSTVVHRLLADAMGDLLIAPRWPPRAVMIENIRRYMLEKGKWQGRMYKKV